MNDTTQRAFSGGELLAGKYRVERVIGEGGMGVVLAARHEGLNTSVAIKLLRSSALEHTDVVGRFMREARAAVSLRSEHVARVFDVGNLEDGRPYIVMERLEGKDLGDVIDQGPVLSVPDAVDYVMQACEAIAEAHAAGIVHRDLKPKNLFLTQAVHGRPLVKVLDFGISKIEPPSGSQEMQLTRTTEIIGSPSYMSPEQLRSSRNVDARTDIWALGVILYELLTKRVPFYAETVTELVLVVVTEKEPPVRALRPDCPEGLEAIVARCLQKQAEHRFQSVVDLVQALEPYAQGVQATITERVRAVASGRAVPSTPNSGALSGPSFAPGSGPNMVPSTGPIAPAASPSSRVNVHGGTSVAWGETQSVVGPNPYVPPPQPSSRLGLVIGLVLGGLVLVSTAIGGTVYYVKRSAHPAPPAVVAGEGSLPLPPGRKDLPPVPTVSSTAATTPPVPDPPAASTLPETRKPPAPATGTARTPAPPKPTAPKGDPKGEPKGDDLSNIGRR
ncbi:MAG: serine/threonine protein kinase [Labilithrix sp.]|nr:serine/threonine protein kinase [Labilithrix sp.]